MESKDIKHLLGAIVLGLIGFCMGYYWCSSTIETEKVDDTSAYVARIIENLEPGSRVEINLKEGIKPSEEYSKGETVEISQNKLLHRICSWFGLAPGEVIARDEGFDIEKGGTTAKFAKSRYGFLARTWTRVKSMFWFLAFGAIILVIMLFIPATAPIAGAIFRFLAAIPPIIGSVVERSVAAAKWQKPLNQTVSGGQEFKQDIKTNVVLNDAQKTEVLRIFKDAMRKEQNNDTKKRIKKIKIMNGFS